MLTFDRRYKLFIWKGNPPPIELDFSPSSGHWYTPSPYIAYLLRDHADSEAAGALAPVIRRVERSAAAQPVLPPTNGLFDYQAAGVEHLVDQFRAGRRHLLLADDPGCVSGDAEVSIQRCSLTRKRNLRDAYKRFNGIANVKGITGPKNIRHISGHSSMGVSVWLKCRL